MGGGNRVILPCDARDNERFGVAPLKAPSYDLTMSQAQDERKM